MRHFLGIVATLLLACAGADAPRAELRVGTSGDYAPFSVRGRDGARAGFDVELVRLYARERGLDVRWVPMRWATLERDFAAGRYDVVASGVTVRPERSLAGRFTVPIATSGLVLIGRGEALPAGALRIGVNAGGHLERAARRRFPVATIQPISPNAAVREALLSGAEAIVASDTLEAPAWLAGTSGFVVHGPYTHDWKAWWLPAGASERASDLDAWLLAREADGTLAALRATHLPEAAREPASAPLAGLAAALAERLALMPLVAEAKRAADSPVRVPAQEEAVLASAVAAVSTEAERLGRAAPSEAATRAFFAALIEAARAVQEETLAGPPAAAPAPDLDAALRPALARITQRIAWLVVRLPSPLGRVEVERALAPLDLAPAFRERITRALLALAR